MRFALTAVFGLVLAVRVAADDKPSADEQKTIDVVEKAGGKATIDTNLAAEARVAAKFDAITDATLLALKKLPQVGAIEAFDASRCTIKGFAGLMDLPHLHTLVLGKSALTPAAANAIGQCKELRHLGLVEAGLNDAGLASLKNLSLLHYLSLSGNPKITDKGMQTVKGFERLQVLYLSNTSIGDMGLAELKVLDGLRTLNVGNTKVTAEAADKFADDMPNLRTVRR